MVRELAFMYSDHCNELYLTILKPVLRDFVRMNLLFQQKSVNQYSLLLEQENFTLVLMKRILYPNSVSLSVNWNIASMSLPLDKVGYGYGSTSLLNEKVRAKLKCETDVSIIQSRCQKFLTGDVKELIHRLPENCASLRKIQNFSSLIYLSHMRSPLENLLLCFAEVAKLIDIESQWCMLLTINWENIFDGQVPTAETEFWTKAITVKNAGGELVLKDLAEFALKLRSLPMSNAVAERVLSHVSIVKTMVKAGWD